MCKFKAFKYRLKGCKIIYSYKTTISQTSFNSYLDGWPPGNTWCCRHFAFPSLIILVSWLKLASLSCCHVQCLQPSLSWPDSVCIYSPKCLISCLLLIYIAATFTTNDNFIFCNIDTTFYKHSLLPDTVFVFPVLPDASIMVIHLYLHFGGALRWCHVQYLQPSHISWHFWPHASQLCTFSWTNQPTLPTVLVSLSGQRKSMPGGSEYSE